MADPKTSPALKEKLQLVQDARRFAFDRMHLHRSRDYSTFSPVPGPYLTYVVTASEKTRFESYYWSFPFVGAFPYKGYFDRKDARREKENMERRGFDADLGGVEAYNAPGPFSNPVPSTVLDEPEGDLACLIIHELTHGTVWFKSQVDFNESMATFVGEQGAQDFLASRYGADSKELAEFRRGLEQDKAYAQIMDDLYSKLDALYASHASPAEKLKLREPIFRAGEARLKEAGFAPASPLNNAAILAHRIYHDDLGQFKEAYERSGRDWPKTIELFKSLDRRNPAADLRRKLSS